MIRKKNKPGSDSAHFTHIGYVSSSDKTWAFLLEEINETNKGYKK